MHVLNQEIWIVIIDESARHVSSVPGNLLPCFKVTYSRLLIDESAVHVGVCLNDWLTFNSTVMMPMGHSDFVA